MEGEWNVFNKRMLLTDMLKRLKDECGVVAVKAEFEAEGSRKDELIMLRELVYCADLGFIIKIGGCEAVHDLDQCKLLDATGIMAPMIETPFAMKKFRGAAQKVYKDNISDVEWIINAETKTCLANYDEILEMGFGFLTGVTVGRSDLSASMGISKENIECREVFEATYELVCKSKEKGLITNFGGNIGVESIPFIKKIDNKIDRFETRKIVISQNESEEMLKKAIKFALEFELEYLKFKSDYYGNMASEDAIRIVRLNKQLSL